MLLSNDSIICYGSFDIFLYKNAVQHPKRHMLLMACVAVPFMTAGYKKMPVKTQNVKQKFSNKSISLQKISFINKLFKIASIISKHQ